MTSYLSALGVTLLVEVPVYVGALALLLGVPWRRAAVTAAVVNLVTHPVVWVVLHPGLVGGGRHTSIVLAAEAFAWLAEAVMLRLRFGRGTPEIVAMTAVGNAASVLAGVALLG